MKNLAFQILFIVLFIGKVQSQNNALRIFYAPAASYLNEFYVKYPNRYSPNRIFMGYVSGIEYGRTIENFNINIGYRYTLKGTKTAYYYNSLFRYFDDHVGEAYDQRSYSNEFFLTASTRLFPKRKNWNLSVGIGLSADVYRGSITQVYGMNKEYGFVGLGAEFGGIGGTPQPNDLKRMIRNINAKNYRFGFSAFLGVDIKLLNHFYLNLQPEIEYLTKPVAGIVLYEPGSINKSVKMFALQTGIKFKF